MWNDHLPAECSVLLWLNEFKEPLYIHKEQQLKVSCGSVETTCQSLSKTD